MAGRNNALWLRVFIHTACPTEPEAIFAFGSLLNDHFNLLFSLLLLIEI